MALGCDPRRRHMTKDRLSPLDASFLQLEDATSHMHVAGVLIFAGQPPPYERLLAHVESRLGLVPRYRQRVAEVPLAQARPRWVDDERFDLRYHVRNTALPAPGSEAELQVLAARVFSHHLRRERPLWEMWLVEGLDRDRFAILSKTHHALVDGVSGLDILSVLFAPDEEESGPWRPEPCALLRRAGDRGALRACDERRRARAPARRRRATPAQDRQPHRRDRRSAPARWPWRVCNRRRPTPYNAGQVGPDRRFTWTRASLDDVKAIKNTLGGTVNDVVLTVVTLALRRHLIRRGEDIDELELKAFVPVSVRTEDQRGTLGNQVSGMVTTLPVSCADPVQSLAEISAEMRAVKHSGQTIGAKALTELSGFAPPTLLHEAARLVTRQRLVNLVVTNVPGPQFPLYLAGRELTDLFPIVPLGANLNLGVAVVSYNGALDFGLVGDFVVMHDLDDLADDFRAAVLELTAAATGAHAGEPTAPWPGYDQQTVPVIAKRLHRAGEDVASAVRSYELEHKHRRGVIDATERPHRSLEQ